MIVVVLFSIAARAPQESPYSGKPRTISPTDPRSLRVVFGGNTNAVAAGDPVVEALSKDRLGAESWVQLGPSPSGLPTATAIVHRAAVALARHACAVYLGSAGRDVVEVSPGVVTVNIGAVTP